MPVLDEIKPRDTYETYCFLTVKGDIGSGAKVTVANSGITAVSVGPGATIRAEGRSTFSGDIGAKANVTVANGGITAVSVGPGATIHAEGRSTFSGGIGANAHVTVVNGGITAISVGSGATIRAEGRSTFSGDIGSSANVTVFNGNLTVSGNIESGATIILNGGLLTVNGTISPDCTITGASNLSDYSTKPNDSGSITARDGGVNFIGSTGGSFMSGSGVNTSTSTDGTGRKRVICQNTSSGEITVNGYKMPFIDKYRLITSRDMVNGYEVKIDDQGVLVNGQRVVDGVIQATSQPAVSSVVSNENIASILSSSTGPAFLAAPSPEQKNESESLLQKNAATDNDRCCCVVM